MPRTIKPRSGWRAAAIVPHVKLSRPHFRALAEAAGLDWEDENDRAALRGFAERVTDAIGVYRAQRDIAAGAPRPIHQRAALQRLQGAIEALLDAFNALDDASLDGLTTGRNQFDVARALEQLRRWSGTVTLALRDLDGRESRGRIANEPRRILLWLLADIFESRKNAKGANLADFLQAGCQAAGENLSTREAQTQATELLRVNTP